MAGVDSFLFQLEAECDNANTVKEIVLAKLCEDGLITSEQYEKYTKCYQVIIYKTSWFKKWASVFRGEEKNEGAYTYKYVQFETELPKKR